MEPEARQGMFDFFRVHDFIHPGSRLQNYAAGDLCYFKGGAAVLFSGNWVMQMLAYHEQVLPVVAETTQIAPPAGVPYVGAAHLVIWRHSIHADEAFQLVRHVTSPEVLRKVFLHTGGFPARLDVLNLPPFSTNDRLRVVRDCLKRRRGFRSAHLWAGVEMLLNEMCDQLWAALFANPDLDLAMEIEQRVKTTAERLEKTLLAGKI